MKVLMATSEASPFIKTGGLGDVIGGLTKVLKKQEVDIRVIMPKYKAISKEYTKDFEFIKWFMVDVGWRRQYCGVFKYEYNGVIYYFLDNEYYFFREGIYGEYDDAERFAFFDRAVLNLLKEIGWKPDILHCNDWQTGMIPVLYKSEYDKDNFYDDIRMVFSIHNLYFQGIFSTNILPDIFGYDYELFLNGSLELNGGISFLKGAINYSDKILTVSDTYSKEIQTLEYGEGLDILLKYKSFFVKGILNGIDYDEYNPEKDKYILKTYSIDNIENKGENKEDLQKELGLIIKRDVPMIAMVSRLTNQKGIDLVINMLDRLLQKDIQVVILGSGENIYEEILRSFQNRYRDKLSVNIMFNESLAHKIYAAADIFLMPSLFEPCGLGQLISLRYGTIPIVRETGGLKDTILSYNEYNGQGNGFSFKNYNVSELMRITEYALNLFKNKKVWNSLMIQAMKSDNSWEKVSYDYRMLYDGMLNR